MELSHLSNFKEITAAVPDALMMKSGLIVHNAHPLAEKVSNMPLQEIATAFGLLEIQRKPSRNPASPHGVFAIGLQSPDLASSLGSGLLDLMLQKYNALAEHRAICMPIEVNDFRPVELSFLDISEDLAPIGENAEIPQLYQGAVFGAGAVSQLSSFGRVLHVSREVIVNDQWGIVAKAFSALGAGSSRLENKLVFSALEANPTLPDGESMFHDAHQNVVAGTLDGSGLAAAMALLRNQPTLTGTPAGHKGRYLVASPALEYAAIKLVHEAGLDLRVVASPNILAARWYLMADPVIAPVVGRLHLKGAAATPFTVGMGKRDIASDGVAMKLIADHGVSILGRVGIVRGGTV